MPPGVVGDAVFDPEGNYRYWLERTWDRSRPSVTYLLLNPSTAGDRTDDPTTRKLRHISSVNGAGGFVLVNLFASIDTHQDGLHLDGAAGGTPGENDSWVRRAITRAPRIVIGWGSANGGTAHRGERRRALTTRVREVWPLLAGLDLWCVGHNREGSPRHPTRGIRNDVRLIPYVRRDGYP